MIYEPTLFDADRMNPAKAFRVTTESLRSWGARYRHWAVAFSGGKDSTLTLTLLCHLLETKQIPAPESLTVLYADTRMELPPLAIGAARLMAEIAARGTDGRIPCHVTCRTVLPKLDERFYVYMLGRGIPPPTNTFRWCTSQIKVEPMLTALQGLRESTGEKLLMLTGVRVGESAARDQRIAVSCGKNGAECGQGWFQESTPESVADTLAPILHWRVCHVWDWLRNDATRLGYPTGLVADVYGGNRAEEINARTGCVGCNLASKDVALDRVLHVPGWEYLRPLKNLKPLYAELRQPSNRLRKHGETLKDGTFVATDRMGPLTLSARQYGLDTILETQRIIQENAPWGLDSFTLIDSEEEGRIHELIAANTYPNRWDGTEDRGDVVRPVRLTRGGGRQMQMMIEEASRA